MQPSHEHSLENLGVTSTLASSYELVEKVCEEIVVTHESVSDAVELEHEVTTEGIEMENKMEKSDEKMEIALMCLAKAMNKARKHSLFTNLFAPSFIPF